MTTTKVINHHCFPKGGAMYSFAIIVFSEGIPKLSEALSLKM
jgi:hypothetical protein